MVHFARVTFHTPSQRQAIRLRDQVNIRCLLRQLLDRNAKTFLLWKFYKIIPPLISAEWLTHCESGWAPGKLHCVHKNHQTCTDWLQEGEVPLFLPFTGVLGYLLGSPLLGFTHAAFRPWLCKYQSFNRQQEKQIKSSHVPIYHSLTDGIPCKTGSFEMVWMICNICVNNQSILGTHSKSSTTWASPESQGCPHVSSDRTNYVSKQVMISLEIIYTELLIGDSLTAYNLKMQRIFQGGRFFYWKEASKRKYIQDQSELF